MKMKLIMIIDDDKEDIEIFCAAIEKVHPVLECIDFQSAEKALTYLKKKTNTAPDMIFLDVNMPQTNGMDCLGEIKQLKHLKGMQVIMYSTSILQEDKNTSTKLGAEGFLRKPNTFNQLCMSLKEILN